MDDWIDTERLTEPHDPDPVRLRSAIAISLLLHGVLLGVFWRWSLQDAQETPVQSTVQINLLPPARETVVGVEPGIEASGPMIAPPVPEQEPVAAGPSPAVASEVVPAPPEPSIAVHPETVVSIPAVPEPADQAPELQVRSPAPQLPSPMSLRQAVSEFSANREAVGVQDCTFLQAQSELLDCPQSQQTEFGAASRTRAVLSFDIAGALDNTQGIDGARRAMGTIADNRASLQADLDASSLEGIDRQYLEEELRQGIEVYSGSGNTPLKRLEDRINRNDAAYQQMQRILNPR